jgi:hypothetical protein
MKKKPFNVTLIVSPDYPHSLALSVIRRRTRISSDIGGKALSPCSTAAVQQVRELRELYRDRASFQAQCKRHAARFRMTDPLPAVRKAVSTYPEAATGLTSYWRRWSRVVVSRSVIT